MENEYNNPIDQHTPINPAVQKDLPNSGGILAMGIISIVLAGLIGLILSIITLSLATNARNLYNNNPGVYTAASMSRVNAGRVCAIVGLCLLGLVLLIVIAAAALN